MRGFEVLGFEGWKGLRDREGTPRIRPVFLCNLLAVLSQPVVRWIPGLAFRRVLIKRLDVSARDGAPARNTG